MKAVITDAGITAANLAQSTGPKVDINKFRIGSTAGYEPTYDQTDIKTVVYSGGAERMRYRVVSGDIIMYTIRLDQSVGDFVVGEIALQLDDGTPFAIATLPTAETKLAARPSQGVVGNDKSFDIFVKLARLPAFASFTIVINDDFSFPEVETKEDLPTPASATAQVYLVRRVVGHGRAAVAFLINGAWEYRYVGRTDFDEDDLRGPFVPDSLWSGASTPGRAVYLNREQNRYLPATRSAPDARPWGVRGHSGELVWCGAKFTATSNTYLPGTFYYVQSNGELSSDPPRTPGGEIDTGFLVGYALTPRELLVLAGTSFALPYATETTPGIVKLATETEVNTGTGDNVVRARFFRNLTVAQATETRMGIAEIATQVEVDAGVNDEWFVTPKKLKGYIDNKVLPIGSRLPFVQPTVPAGWRLITDVHDRMLRVVNQAPQGGITGGGWNMASEITVNVQPHTLTIDEIPPHEHMLPRKYWRHLHGQGRRISSQRDQNAPEYDRTLKAGGGKAHAHGATVTSTGAWRPSYLNVLVCERTG